jgi:hypothetical protein
MREAELAYVAGLFDGEGHCRVVQAKASNGARYYRAHAMIYNTDRRCLDYAKEILGFGWVGLNARGTKTKKPCFKWQAQNVNAIEFLNLIRPYVKIKCEQIDAVLVGPNHGRVL